MFPLNTETVVLYVSNYIIVVSELNQKLYDLHSPNKSMKQVEATGVGFTEDDTPAFTFRAELHDGRDFDGKFNIAFAAIESDNERRLAIVKGAEKEIIAQFDEDDSLRIIDGILSDREYVVCINYANTTYEVPPDGVCLPVLGRVVGSEFDWVERTELPQEYIDSLNEIRDVIESQ